ncbi:hypothetical protein P7K49_010073, partial [Saguinus oedipus]
PPSSLNAQALCCPQPKWSPSPHSLSHHGPAHCPQQVSWLLPGPLDSKAWCLHPRSTGSMLARKETALRPQG